jgi:hypothetical protein
MRIEQIAFSASYRKRDCFSRKVLQPEKIYTTHDNIYHNKINNYCLPPKWVIYENRTFKKPKAAGSVSSPLFTLLIFASPFINGGLSFEIPVLLPFPNHQYAPRNPGSVSIQYQYHGFGNGYLSMKKNPSPYPADQ